MQQGVVVCVSMKWTSSNVICMYEACSRIVNSSENTLHRRQTMT